MTSLPRTKFQDSAYCVPKLKQIKHKRQMQLFKRELNLLTQKMNLSYKDWCSPVQTCQYCFYSSRDVKKYDVFREEPYREVSLFRTFDKMQYTCPWIYSQFVQWFVMVMTWYKRFYFKTTVTFWVVNDVTLWICYYLILANVLCNT